MEKEQETFRVKIYSLPSKNGETKLRYFADVPEGVVGQVIAHMLPHGKAVKNN